MGDIQAATAIANGAGPQEALQYLAEVTDRRKQLGISTERLDGMIAFMQQNPQEGVEGLNAMTDSLIEQGFLKAPQVKGQNQKQINVLRSNVDKATADLKKVDAAFRKIQKAGKVGTPAADMSLIFSYMKILDPGSTVREGEFATAQDTTGIPGKIVNAYNRALAGTRLNDVQRKDFISQAESLFKAQQESADFSIEGILQRADEDQIGRQMILGGNRLKEFNERQAALDTGPIASAVVPGQVELQSLSLEELKALRAQSSQP